MSDDWQPVTDGDPIPEPHEWGARMAKRTIEHRIITLQGDERREFIRAGLDLTKEFYRIAFTEGREVAMQTVADWHDMAPAIVLYWTDTLNTLGADKQVFEAAWKAAQ